MKKYMASLLIMTLLCLFSVNVMSMDKLITIPSADLIGGKGYFAGEIVSSSYRQLEASYNLNPVFSVGGVVNFSDNEDSNQIGILMKTVLAQETADRPAISAGIRMRDLYFVTSKEIGMGFRGHIGIGNGDIGGLFLGFNKVLNPVSISQGDSPSLPVMNLMGEYADEKINIGLRMGLQDNMELDLGLLDFKNVKVGLGYVF